MLFRLPRSLLRYKWWVLYASHSTACGKDILLPLFFCIWNIYGAFLPFPLYYLQFYHLSLTEPFLAQK